MQTPLTKTKKMKKYKITLNIEDHVGYSGQLVWIIDKHPDNYFTVTDGVTQWHCGEEELTPITA